MFVASRFAVGAAGRTGFGPAIRSRPLRASVAPARAEIELVIIAAAVRLCIAPLRLMAGARTAIIARGAMRSAPATLMQVTVSAAVSVTIIPPHARPVRLAVAAARRSAGTSVTAIAVTTAPLPRRTARVAASPAAHPTPGTVERTTTIPVTAPSLAISTTRTARPVAAASGATPVFAAMAAVHWVPRTAAGRLALTPASRSRVPMIAIGTVHAARALSLRGTKRHAPTVAPLRTAPAITLAATRSTGLAAATVTTVTFATTEIYIASAAALTITATAVMRLALAAAVAVTPAAASVAATPAIALATTRPTSLAAATVATVTIAPTAFYAAPTVTRAITATAVMGLALAAATAIASSSGSVAVAWAAAAAVTFAAGSVAVATRLSTLRAAVAGVSWAIVDGATGSAAGWAAVRARSLTIPGRRITGSVKSHCGRSRQ